MSTQGEREPQGEAGSPGPEPAHPWHSLWASLGELPAWHVAELILLETQKGPEEKGAFQGPLLAT